MDPMAIDGELHSKSLNPCISDKFQIQKSKWRYFGKSRSQ
jgi:hypothetical protein